MSIAAGVGAAAGPAMPWREGAATSGAASF